MSDQTPSNQSVRGTLGGEGLRCTKTVVTPAMFGDNFKADFDVTEVLTVISIEHT